MLNQKYGRLTIIKLLPRKVGKRLKCLCRCEDGVELEVVAKDLVSGNTQSCGCLRRDRNSEVHLKNILGRRFGRLVIIGYEESLGAGRHPIWKCQCDCGKIVLVESENLIHKRTMSCGCYRKELCIKKYNSPDWKAMLRASTMLRHRRDKRLI